MPVVLRRRGSAGGVAVGRRRRDQPERVAVAVEARGDGLQRHDDRGGRRATGAARSRSGGGTGRRGGADAARAASSEAPTRHGMPATARSPSRVYAGYHRPTMADQLSLRLEADQLPELPDLRPMLAAPAARAVRFGRAPVRAVVGRRAGAGRSSARPTCRGAGEVRIVDADGRGSDRGAARAGRAGRAGRGTLGDPRRRAGRRRRRRPSRSPRSSRARLRASAGRPAAFLAFDLLHLDGRSLLSQPLVRRREALRRVLRPGDEVVAVPAIATEGSRPVRGGRRPGHGRDAGPPAPESVPAGHPQPAVAVHPGGRGNDPRRGAGRGTAEPAATSATAPVLACSAGCRSTTTPERPG